MLKLYASLLFIILLSSCGTSVKYVGQTLQATNNKIDVFVDASSITKSYTIIGKGYIDYTFRLNYERMQRKAVNIAKEKGADAVLFEDLHVVDKETSLTTSISNDSSRTVKAHNSVNPVLLSRQQILFLKYK